MSTIDTHLCFVQIVDFLLVDVIGFEIIKCLQNQYWTVESTQNCS